MTIIKLHDYFNSDNIELVVKEHIVRVEGYVDYDDGWEVEYRRAWWGLYKKVKVFKGKIRYGSKIYVANSKPTCVAESIKEIEDLLKKSSK